MVRNNGNGLEFTALLCLLFSPSLYFACLALAEACSLPFFFETNCFTSQYVNFHTTSIRMLIFSHL